MKKIFLSFILIIITLLVFTYIQKTNLHRVFYIKSPQEVFVDLNDNLIFDETTPVVISGIENIDTYKKYDILKDLSKDEIFFASYFANDLANKLLKNKHVKYENDDILVDNQKYSKLLLDSYSVFDKTEQSQLNFLKYIKSFNLDEYFVYNLMTKKYHKFNCKTIKNLKKYKIIHKSQLNNSMTACPYCLAIDKKKRTKSFHTYSSDTYNHISSYISSDIKIYFLDLNHIMKPSAKCTTSACKALKNEIDKTKTSIDFAIYGIDFQPEIFDALVKAYKRGVKIRWVTDYDKKNNNYYKDTISLMQFIPTYNTDELYEKNNISAIMHNKFFIFDSNKVWTGSSNITGTDLTGFNANYSLLIYSKELASIYTNEFNQMYNGLFHSDKKYIANDSININSTLKIQALFSPQDKIIENSLVPLILNAKKYIYIPIFFFTSKDIANALIAAHKRGVEIKVITDATNSHTKYTVHKLLRNAGIKVKTENYAGKMHMKAMIIDDSVSVLGSMNYTKSANIKNDENIVVIYNKDITQYLKLTFMYLWNKIPNRYEYFDPKAESIESIGSCFDGIDNDFDSKIDMNDEGCFKKH